MSVIIIYIKFLFKPSITTLNNIYKTHFYCINIVHNDSIFYSFLFTKTNDKSATKQRNIAFHPYVKSIQNNPK